MAPIRFISWVLGLIFTLGFVDAFGQLTYKVAKAAVGAHVSDQVSYSTYTRLLWSKPHPTRGRDVVDEQPTRKSAKPR